MADMPPRYLQQAFALIPEFERAWSDPVAEHFRSTRRSSFLSRHFIFVRDFLLLLPLAFFMSSMGWRILLMFAAMFWLFFFWVDWGRVRDFLGNLSPLLSWIKRERRDRSATLQEVLASRDPQRLDDWRLAPLPPHRAALLIAMEAFLNRPASLLMFWRYYYSTTLLFYLLTMPQMSPMRALFGTLLLALHFGLFFFHARAVMGALVVYDSLLNLVPAVSLHTGVQRISDLLLEVAKFVGILVFVGIQASGLLLMARPLNWMAWLAYGVLNAAMYGLLVLLHTRTLRALGPEFEKATDNYALSWKGLPE